MLHTHNPSTSSVQDCMKGPESYAELRQRSGLPIKNFMQLERASLKLTQQENRNKQVVEEPKITANKEYDYIESVVLKQMEAPDTITSARQFLARGSGVQRLRSNAASMQDKCRDELVELADQPKPNVPRRTDTLQLAPRRAVNFIHQNFTIQPKKASDSDADISECHHESYGEVPAYLVARKREEEDRLDRERKLSEEYNSSSQCVMSEEERLSTLSRLNQAYTKLEGDLCKMPIIVDTPSLIRRKQAIECKMEEVRQAIIIFSSMRVVTNY